MTTNVTTRGQVSIPAGIRKRFHIEAESKVEWLVEGDEIKLVPLPKDIVTAFRGRGGKKYGHDRFLKDRREDRARENADDE